MILKGDRIEIQPSEYQPYVNSDGIEIPPSKVQVHLPSV